MAIPKTTNSKRVKNMQIERKKQRNMARMKKSARKK